MNQVSADLDREWQAVILLASPNVSERYQSELEQSLRGPVNYRRLDRMLQWHRVSLAAAVNLSVPLQSSLPEFFTSALSLRRDNAQLRARRQFQAQSRLSALLRKAGVEHRLFKGLTLGQLLHDDLAVRQSNDIDVMIHRQDLDLANACLVELGYSSILADGQAALTGNRLAVALAKDVVYTAKGLPVVELHWRIDNADTHFGQFYSRILFHLPPNKPTPEEFVYLCWHAGKTLHHRLKWLVDVDCYLRLGEQQEPGFCEQALIIAREQGVERYLLLALYLLQRTFPWHAQRQYESATPIAIQRIGQRIQRRWRTEELAGKDKLVMMWDRFYLPRLWRDRCAIAKSLLLLPTDDVRAMLNRHSGMSAGLARVLVPLLLVRGYWRR